MGCAESQMMGVPVRTQTKVGYLDIIVQSIHIDHVVSSISGMDPYITLKLSNQKFQTQIKYNGGADVTFQQKFLFIINSCFQSFGRTLQMEVWDKNKIGQSQIGFGIVDINKILEESQEGKPAEKIKCWINYNSQPAGYIILSAKFTSCKYETFHFKFHRTTIRRKTSLIGDMNCYIKVTVGEEELCTEKCKDTQQVPPTWTNQVLTCLIPNIDREITSKIQLYDENKLIGDLPLNLKELFMLTEQKQQVFNHDLLYDDSQQAASLKYSIIRGEKTSFDQLVAVQSKLIPKSKIETPRNNQVLNKQDGLRKKQLPNKLQPIKNTMSTDKLLEKKQKSNNSSLQFNKQISQSGFNEKVNEITNEVDITKNSPQIVKEIKRQQIIKEVHNGQMQVIKEIKTQEIIKHANKEQIKQIKREQTNKQIKKQQQDIVKEVDNEYKQKKKELKDNLKQQKFIERASQNFKEAQKQTEKKVKEVEKAEKNLEEEAQKKVKEVQKAEKNLEEEAQKKVKEVQKTEKNLEEEAQKKVKEVQKEVQKTEKNLEEEVQKEVQKTEKNLEEEVQKKVEKEVQKQLQEVQTIEKNLQEKVQNKADKEVQKQLQEVQKANILQEETQKKVKEVQKTEKNLQKVQNQVEKKLQNAEKDLKEEVQKKVKKVQKAEKNMEEEVQKKMEKQVQKELQEIQKVEKAIEAPIENNIHKIQAEKNKKDQNDKLGQSNTLQKQNQVKNNSDAEKSAQIQKNHDTITKSKEN